MLLGSAPDIQHVAARGLDEQRFLGAEIIGDLAREGVGGSGNVGDRNAGQPFFPEQAACGIKQARPHRSARRARGAHAVPGVAWTRIACSAAHAVSRGNKVLVIKGLLLLYVIQTICQGNRIGSRPKGRLTRGTAMECSGYSQPTTCDDG